MKFFTFKWKNRQEQNYCSTPKHANDYGILRSKFYGEKNPPEIFELQTEFSVSSFDNLQKLLDEIKAAGITDLTKISFDNDYSNCYYEGDSPDLKAVYKI